MVETTIVIGYDTTQSYVLKEKKNVIFIIFFVRSLRLFGIYVSMTITIYDIVWRIGFELAIILSNWYIVNCENCVVRMIYNPIEIKLENLSLSTECKCVLLMFQYYFHFIGQLTCPTIEDRRLNIATTMTFD